MRIGGVSVKDLLTALAVLAFAFACAWTACGCPLHNPVPVDPDYPVETVHDAGRE